MNALIAIAFVIIGLIAVVNSGLARRARPCAPGAVRPHPDALGRRLTTGPLDQPEFEPQLDLNSQQKAPPKRG